MKIFVAGATGVIGSRAVPLLIAAGHQVTAVARSRVRGSELERVGANPVMVDLFDREQLYRVIAGHDAVINLATHLPASTTRMLLPGAWRENDRIRNVASCNLVDAAIAAGAERFIQESFAPIYRDCRDAWIHEDTPMEPASFNHTILDAEAAAQRFTAGGGAGVVLRFAAFYGPDAFQSKDMISFVRRGWAPLPGEPEAFFSSISHDDAATAVLSSLEVPAGVYNITDDEPLTRRDYAGALASALGVRQPKPLPSWLTGLTGSLGKLMSRSLRISNRKFRNHSDWTPGYPSVREGWQSVIESSLTS